MLEEMEQSDLLIESRQYRSPAGRKALNLRNVADFAFVDMITLYVLSQEYETGAMSSNYANKTMGFRNFLKPRLSGTDLYISLNILSDPDGYFGQSIASNPANDALLRSKLSLNLPTLRRYFDLLQDGKLNREDAAVLFLRLEKQLNIISSPLKSMRRLAQDYAGLNTMQRQLLVTRLLQFYHKNAKRSELAVFLEDLGKSKGYILSGPIDAELTNLGYKSAFAQAAKAALPLAGMAAGYKIGQALVGKPTIQHKSH
jgi:hypothetical protein